MSKKPNAAKRAADKVKENNENGARKAILEDLFYDFNRSRAEIYKTNFMRGIFLGFGTVIGGTIIIAIILWMLNLLVDVPGGIGDFVKSIIEIVESGK